MRNCKLFMTLVVCPDQVRVAWGLPFFFQLDIAARYYIPGLVRAQHKPATPLVYPQHTPT